MKRAHVAIVGATLLSATSGAAYAFLRYCVEPRDEFSAWNHPLQPWVLGAHVLLAPAVVFAFGWVFGEHVLERLSQGPRGQHSGLTVLALGALMIASGTALPLCSDGTWRAICGWAHGVAGALFAAGLLLHALLPLLSGSKESSWTASSSIKLPRSRKSRLSLRS